MPNPLTARLKDQAHALGFDLVGVSAPEPSPDAAGHYQDWVEAGMAGEMGYMARPDRVAKTRRPTDTLSEMRSMVVVGKSYFTGDLPSTLRDDPARGLIASYAWGRDYHDVLRPRLVALGDWLRSATGSTVKPRAWVDTGPVLERDAAVRAGMGFIGRNTMLIHPRWGSWLFLGALLTDTELDFDGPDPAGTCGRCTRCLTACPTAAFPQPYVLDARLCISYLTIELKGPIPRPLRAPLGNRIFGCDICNEVCPYNVRFARRTADPELTPRLDQVAPPLLDLIGLDEDAFNHRFGDTPLARPGRRGLLRNVCVALGNWGDPEAGAALITALRDPEPLIRGHAAWALGRVGGSAAREALQRDRRRETDAWVAEEVALALHET